MARDVQALSGLSIGPDKAPAFTDIVIDEMRNKPFSLNINESMSRAKHEKVRLHCYYCYICCNFQCGSGLGERAVKMSILSYVASIPIFTSPISLLHISGFCFHTSDIFWLSDLTFCFQRKLIFFIFFMVLTHTTSY